MGSQSRAASAAGGEIVAPTVGDHVSSPHPAVETVALLYCKEKPGLLRSLRRGVAGSDEALDVIHDAFVRLLGLGPERLRALDQEQPGAYLNRTTRNILRDRKKIGVRRSAHLHVVADEATLRGSDPVRQLEARDELRRFEAVVMQLRPRARAIYIAHRVDGLSYAEIAAQIGISVKGVEKHMTYAIAAIGQLLDRD